MAHQFDNCMKCGSPTEHIPTEGGWTLGCTVCGWRAVSIGAVAAAESQRAQHAYQAALYKRRQQGFNAQ